MSAPKNPADPTTISLQVHHAVSTAPRALSDPSTRSYTDRARRPRHSRAISHWGRVVMDLDDVRCAGSIVRGHVRNVKTRG